MLKYEWLTPTAPNDEYTACLDSSSACNKGFQSKYFQVLLGRSCRLKKTPEINIRGLIANERILSISGMKDFNTPKIPPKLTPINHICNVHAIIIKALSILISIRKINIKM